MDLKEFCQGIKFDFFQPNEEISVGHEADSKFENLLVEKGGRNRFEILNTRFPYDQEKLVSKLNPFLELRRYSSFAIGGIINKAVELMPWNQVYLNIGIWFGFSLFAAAAGNEDKICIGVDNFTEGSKEGFIKTYLENTNRFKYLYYHDMDYAEYLNNVHKANIGVYYYDGDHRQEHQEAGLLLAEKFFTNDIVVMIDDTNSVGVRQSAEVLLKKGGWEILLDINTWHNQHPTFWDGFLVMRKIK